MSELGQRLISIVREKATANPNFIYIAPNDEIGTCVYMSEGQPSCLLGHALFEVGLIDRDLKSYNNETTFDELANYLGLDIDIDEMIWLEDVQRNQDIGCPWGYAVESCGSV